jgi:hypothetical protein
MRMTNGGELRREGELESEEEARMGSFKERYQWRLNSRL